MAGDFFTDPQFLALLRFWEEQRGEAAVPEWDDAMPTRFPPDLAPYLLWRAMMRRATASTSMSVPPRSIASAAIRLASVSARPSADRSAPTSSISSRR